MEHHPAARGGMTMIPFFQSLLGAYGSFLYFKSFHAHGLLVMATLLDPATGLLGGLGGAVALAVRRLLALPNQVANLDCVNGVLLGLMIGRYFALSPTTILMTFLAGVLAVLVSRLIHALVVVPRGLPVLSAPLFLIGVATFAVGRSLALPWAPLPDPVASDLLLTQGLAKPILAWLVSMGQIYFTPTPSGGLLVALAVLLSSRRLFLVVILAFVVVRVELLALGVLPGSPVLSLAGTSAMLTALMTGGVFARPSGRALLVAVIAASGIGVVALAIYNTFSYVGLPPLSLAFVSTTWLLMTALGPAAGGPWSRYWLTTPQLPETTAEAIALAEVRGVAEGSIGLRAPFLGTWQVYQGWNGPHTHQGEWRHALDFHQVIDGSAHRGDGGQLTDYHCFGAAICSPVHGIVVAYRDDLPDNPPGEVDTRHCWGNHVLIALAGGDYVLLAHLQQGSLTVGEQALVDPGQVLARCGNSGRSPQPHLHLHVQTGSWLGAPTRPFHLAHVVVQQEGEKHLLLDHLPREAASVSSPRPNPVLARALHRAVGRSASFAVEGCTASCRESRAATLMIGGWREASPIHEGLTVTVALDLNGTSWLVSDKQARIALTETDALIALHQRLGPRDPLFDAFLLTHTLTPLCEDVLVWQDAVPIQWLPTPGWLSLIAWCLPGVLRVESRYARQWEPLRRCWEQKVEHRVGWGGGDLWSCRGVAELSESLGLIRFSLHTPTQTLSGHLIRHGLQADHGIVGWESLIQGHAPLSSVTSGS
ncbi:MAG: urea transporter [Magnetococcales bacterium]|nr:urea transporter [Magnetococcales bacterium]